MNIPKNSIKVCLTSMTSLNTQRYILASIFEENRGKWLLKRDIEKYQGLRWSFKNIDELYLKNITTIKQLIEIAGAVPGDLQRNLRLFYDHLNHLL